MNYREFRSLVSNMRLAQRQYFDSRSGDALQLAKRLEREVDKELLDVGQAKMFEETEA